MTWSWQGAGLGPQAGFNAAIAAVFFATALWENQRPLRAAVMAAGPRWFANFLLFGIDEGLRYVLAPLIVLASGPWRHSLPLPGSPGVRILVIVVALDFTVFVTHRLSHAIAWLWRLHAIHHTDIDLDISTTFRHHPGEMLVVAAILSGAAVLLGATPAEVAAYGAIALAVQVVAHANVALPPRFAALLGRVIVTPEFHRVHHARDERLANANYGEVLVIWDWLFKSAVAPATSQPAEFGVTAFLAPRFGSLGWILLQPFLPRPA